MQNNVFGRRTNFRSQLVAQLRDVEHIYTHVRWRTEVPWDENKVTAAVQFYMDSFNSTENVAEIGRLRDTGKVSGTGGHVQSMKIPGWTPVANDCWMLGCFHSSKIFRLNTLSTSAIWDDSRPGTSEWFASFPITRREISALLFFGYQVFERANDTLLFSNRNPQKSFNATLKEYALTTTLQYRTCPEVNAFIEKYIPGVVSKG